MLNVGIVYATTFPVLIMSTVGLSQSFSFSLTLLSWLLSLQTSVSHQKITLELLLQTLAPESEDTAVHTTQLSYLWVKDVQVVGIITLEKYLCCINCSTKLVLNANEADL